MLEKVIGLGPASKTADPDRLVSSHNNGWVPPLRRVRELIYLVQEAHPQDRFFADLNITFRSSRQAYAVYRAYDRAFQCLDPDSWHDLSRKAVRHFYDHREGQLKQGFFNQLNEAFAYRYLLRCGHADVRVLPETRRRQPDLMFNNRGHQECCEVKTIGISGQEISRRSTSQVFDGSIYYELTPQFLEKVNLAMTDALKQLHSQNASSLVYLIVNFDDFTLGYYGRYREQLSACIHAHEAPAVVAQVGLLGQRRIVKRVGARSGNRRP